MYEEESTRTLLFFREIYIFFNGNNNKGDTIMKFWNKNYNELTIWQVSIVAVIVGVIAGAISYFSAALGWYDMVVEKITGIWNKIFHK